MCVCPDQIECNKPPGGPRTSRQAGVPHHHGRSPTKGPTAISQHLLPRYSNHCTSSILFCNALMAPTHATHALSVVKETLRPFLSTIHYSTRKTSRDCIKLQPSCAQYYYVTTIIIITGMGPLLLVVHTLQLTGHTYQS